MEAVWRHLERLDAQIVSWLQRNSVPLLRIALGTVFLWFGALKVVGASPVNDLVATTVYWFSPRWFVPLLGVWEMAIGVGLLFRVALRLTLLLLLVQLSGTFLTLVVAPDLAFRGSPLVLTDVGEFVIKNLVLLSAGLAIGGTVRGEGRICPTGETPP
ncbi:MAG: hypothetical protein GX774_13930 [Armatimonadetes bacterium]|jgi:uncharacterized membrane protein YkgB|nr:hypothetical protein [Armatimonadota bacterium]